MDAEFILVYNDRLKSPRQVFRIFWSCEIPSKGKYCRFGQNAIFPKSFQLKNGRFRAASIHTKGGTLCKIWNRRFLGELRKLQKIAQNGRGLVYNDTDLRLAENDNFSKGYSKWAISAKMQGGPFAKFSKSAVFWAELRKLQKIGNTCRILA